MPASVCWLHPQFLYLLAIHAPFIMNAFHVGKLIVLAITPKTGSGSRCINYFKTCKLTQAIFAASDGDLDTRFLLFTSKTVHTWWFNGRIQWFHSSYLVVAESLVNELIESNVWASTITEGARLSTNQTLNSAKYNMNLYCYSYIILKIDYSSLHIRNNLRRNMISSRI